MHSNCNKCVHIFSPPCRHVQIEALADDEVVDGPVYVTINVLDVNNNAPSFNQSVYTAVVRENSPAGLCVLQRKGENNPVQEKKSVIVAVMKAQMEYLQSSLNSELVGEIIHAQHI